MNLTECKNSESKVIHLIASRTKRHDTEILDILSKQGPYTWARFQTIVEEWEEFDSQLEKFVEIFNPQVVANGNGWTGAHELESLSSPPSMEDKFSPGQLQTEVEYELCMSNDQPSASIQAPE